MRTHHCPWFSLFEYQLDKFLGRECLDNGMSLYFQIIQYFRMLNVEARPWSASSRMCNQLMGSRRILIIRIYLPLRPSKKSKLTNCFALSDLILILKQVKQVVKIIITTLGRGLLFHSLLPVRPIAIGPVRGI